MKKKLSLLDIVIVMVIIAMVVALVRKPEEKGTKHQEGVETSKVQERNKTKPRNATKKPKNPTQGRKEEDGKGVPESSIDLRKPSKTPEQLREWCRAHRREKGHETATALREMQHAGLAVVRAKH
jgi:hypothetical protein